MVVFLLVLHKENVLTLQEGVQIMHLSSALDAPFPGPCYQDRLLAWMHGNEAGMHVTQFAKVVL